MFRFARPMRFSHCDPGELRLRAAWTLCTISFATMKSVPLPGDLRAGMRRFLAV